MMFIAKLSLVVVSSIVIIEINFIKSVIIRPIIVISNNWTII